MKNFRGLKQVLMVDTLEGKGTPEDMCRIVHWIYELSRDGGCELIGRIDRAENPDSAQLS